MTNPELKLTPDALLDTPVRDGYVSTLRLIFDEYVVRDGGLDQDNPDAEMNAIAQQLIKAVLRDVAQAADGFGGDACDFGEWINDQLEKK